MANVSTIEEIQSQKEVKSARFGSRRTIQYESLSVLVEDNGTPEAVTLPVLRDIACRIGVDVLNGAGNPKNTRTLGANVIDELLGRRAR